MKSFTTETEAFAVRIKRKDGVRFMATGAGSTVATFLRFADAKDYLDQLRPHIKSTMRVVRITQTIKWREATP